MPPNIAGLPPPPMDAPRSPADIVTSMLLRIREGQSYSSDHQDKIVSFFYIDKKCIDARRNLILR